MSSELVQPNDHFFTCDEAAILLRGGAAVLNESGTMTAVAGALPDLVALVEALAFHRDLPALPSDPFRLVLWDNIGALIPDEKRVALFAEFEAKVGFEPGRILASDPELLLSMAERGGMRPHVRVERWQTCSAIVVERCGGDLGSALRTLPLAKARALLKTFPVIGDPGADKILLFAGIASRPSLDPNGLRTLVRLGYFAQQSSYAASYRAGVRLLADFGRPEPQWLKAAYLRLRAHGKTLCRRSLPLCHACPLDPACAHMPADQF